jgi:ABC-type hemin transport system substrate-binding protein
MLCGTPLDGPPERILSLVPSITEWLWALGLEDEVVGLTRFCVRPPHWKRLKTIVGGTKDVRIDAVRDLKPDLVLANREENTLEVVREISNFSAVYLSDVSDLGSAIRDLKAVGALCGKASQAEQLCAQIEGLWNSRPPETEALRSLYLIWKNPWMAAGAGTFIDANLRSLGLMNLVKEERYPTLSIDQIARLNPDRILLSSEPYPFGQKEEIELSEIFPGVRIQRVDGERFSWYGARMLDSGPWFEKT